MIEYCINTVCSVVNDIATSDSDSVNTEDVIQKLLAVVGALSSVKESSRISQGEPIRASIGQGVALS